MCASKLRDREKKDLTLLTRITTKLENLERYQRLQKTIPALDRETVGRIEGEIAIARSALEVLETQKTRLIVKAPFDGVIRDLAPDIHTGRSVSSQEPLFRIVAPEAQRITAYIGENQLPRVKTGNLGSFRPDYALFEKKSVRVDSIDPGNVKTLSKPELASVYGGNIPSAGENGEIKPLEPTYIIRFNYLKNNDKNNNFTHTQRGQIQIQAQRESALHATFQNFISLIIRESGLN